MQVFSRLAIGTANWGKPYGRSAIKVSAAEQDDILVYCQCHGIDMIDTAPAYEWDWTKLSSYFKVNVKVTQEQEWDREPWSVMAHRAEDYPAHPEWNGVSLYEPSEAKLVTAKTHIVQVPYSLFDRRFESCFGKWNSWHTEIHVRSVFLQGRILEKASPFECIAFCLMNPCVDRVILGADSLKQLQGNLEPFFRLGRLKTEDLNIIDPRKW